MDAAATPPPRLDAAAVSAIVDGLAATGVAILDNALGETHASALRAACRGVAKAPATIAEGTTMTRDVKRRDDVVAWLAKSDLSAVAAHRAAMEALRLDLDARCRLNTDACSYMCAEYKAGANGYVKHRDSAPTKPSGRKRRGRAGTAAAPRSEVGSDGPASVAPQSAKPPPPQAHGVVLSKPNVDGHGGRRAPDLGPH